MTSDNETPGAELRRLLTLPSPTHILGVYDGLSARIAQEAGFGALWASGLCMSTALGVRDSDEASWTDLLAIATRVVETTNLPVLLDGDTGYGNFNTARRFAVQAERIGVAGICLEDKMFPKMNSFVGDKHALAPIGEFCGKIAACRDATRDPSFVIVARVEALIAGASVEEAMRRAEAYCEQGADATFIHSRKSTIDEISEFVREWEGKLPLVICPTTYYDTAPEVFTQLGVGGIIWANQTMRAAASAMQHACRLLRSEGPVKVESMIAPLEDVFSLMNYAQLAKDEQRYSS